MPVHRRIKAFYAVRHDNLLSYAILLLCILQPTETIFNGELRTFLYNNQSSNFLTRQ